MQRKSGSTWKWQATVKTNSTGYYSAWASVCPTTQFRMATAGSAVTSVVVTKIGSTMTAWANSKVHAVLKDGYGDRVGSKTVYLQKWNGSSWGWAGTGTTNGSGYVGFTPKATGAYRVATGGSKVSSVAVSYSAPAVTQVLTSVSRWVSDSTPNKNTNLTVYAIAKDQNGNGIKDAKVVTTWHYKTTTPVETRYSGSNGVASTTRSIGNASSGYKVVVNIAVIFGGKTINTSTSFTPN